MRRKGRKEGSEIRDMALSLSGVKGSFSTCLTSQHRAYIMCVWVSGGSDRCAAGIHKHPSAAGWVTAQGLGVPWGIKGQERTL